MLVDNDIIIKQGNATISKVYQGDTLLYPFLPTEEYAEPVISGETIGSSGSFILVDEANWRIVTKEGLSSSHSSNIFNFTNAQRVGDKVKVPDNALMFVREGSGGIYIDGWNIPSGSYGTSSLVYNIDTASRTASYMTFTFGGRIGSYAELRPTFFDYGSRKSFYFRNVRFPAGTGMYVEKDEYVNNNGRIESNSEGRHIVLYRIIA